VDSLVWQAREAHRKACEHSGLSGHFIAERNRIIRELHATGDYSYSKLAGQIGCSPELIAKIVQGRS
jgi:hypothetical protein